ncbi:dynamin family protein [Acinetobacter rudis]|uniref:Dynamin family protein n=1 Tax=Acinetobacter rudis TaxID=632955 RepID=A0AAW8J9L3_9GAMM|nr:dynamin family protein [Acinetobacter rudis]MDQ8936248.1 dynamin family protein [Acinetobacter rudis]MDQ9018511.1 dynamin family protein [Acinetobacter rudis]
MSNIRGITGLSDLKNEVQILLSLGLKALNQMINLELLVDLDQDNTFAYQAIAALRSEYLKLEQQKTIITVVGTMKAGKSTAINAIVGREILPNRNAPMTAIPTLIKHYKGRQQPHLILTDIAREPIVQLIQDLQVAFADPCHQHKLDQLRSDQDLFMTVEKIQQDIQVIDEVVGEVEILEFMILINDLIRISPVLDLEFPFDLYQDIERLPIIEVEFIHFADSDEFHGQLILIDTPGPNEAGQPHLRAMLQQQLQHASSVIVVMDYTQLKSEADAQVREDLKEFVNTMDHRIYALVNKFDNCDRNGMKQDELKTFVEGLTQGLIAKQYVYPISAKLAYLANQAKQSYLLHGTLPDAENVAWVEDFYVEAGLRRVAHRTTEHILDGIEDLWQQSKFKAPLDGVIKASHQQSLLVILDSAIDKLISYVHTFNQMRVKKFSELCKGIYGQGAAMNTDHIGVMTDRIFNKLQIDMSSLEKSAQLLKQSIADLASA